MINYILLRLGSGVVTLLFVSMIVFFIVRVIPGDAAVMMTGAGAGVVTEEELDAVRQRLGIDRPLPVQFVDWLGDAVRFDFGTSLRTGAPVAQEIAQRFPYTLQIAVMAMAIAIVVGVPSGVLAARFAGSWLDRGVQTFSVLGLAAPSFWIGLLIILALITFFRWSAPLFWEPFWVNPVQSTVQLIWPALAAGLRQLAIITRMTRSIMLEILREDYIRTARAKGLSETRVVFRHGLTNGSLPIVTLVGFEFAALFGSLIITEAVFNVPGLGQYVINAIMNRDYPAAQAIVLILACIVVMANLIVDLIYGWLDPRMRLKAKAA